MIPVRVPADITVPITGGIKTIDHDHLYAKVPCPVCDEPTPGTAVVLVVVGIEPEDRKDSGWTNGGAVIVHADCAGYAGADTVSAR